jgi:hypothetical protein
MKKHFNKTARHGHQHRIALGIHGINRGYDGLSDSSPYYAYPPVMISVEKVPPLDIQQGSPLLWNPRLLQDKYSQLMPPTVIRIAADYIGRFI